MRAKQLIELNNDELLAKLGDLKKELFNLRFSHATGQLSNPMQMVVCKKDIARCKTILREREIKALKGGAEGAAVSTSVTAKKAKALKIREADKTPKKVSAPIIEEAATESDTAVVAVTEEVNVADKAPKAAPKKAKAKTETVKEEGTADV